MSSCPMIFIYLRFDNLDMMIPVAFKLKLKTMNDQLTIYLFMAKNNKDIFGLK